MQRPCDKWVVVHDGPRDNYQIPKAFDERGALSAFVTDWYSRLDRPTSQPFYAVLPSQCRTWLERRYSRELTTGRVIDFKGSALCFAMGRKLRFRWAGFDHWDRLLGEKAANIATRARTNLLSTSYHAADAFRCYKGVGEKILFQIHPSPRFLRRLYEDFLQREGLFNGLRNEAEMKASEEETERWEEEVRLADGIIVASEFTKRSVEMLKGVGVPVYVVPYGVSLDVFRPRLERSDPRNLTVLFVGSKVARKGLHLLLQGWQELRPKSASLRIAGAGTTDQSILRRFQGVGVQLARLSGPELVQEFQNADLFVLPSLAEGYGHVYLEALACGTPIVGTENTAAAELLQEGACGFLTRAGDNEALGKCLESALSNPGKLHKMRAEARRVAEAHTWERFRSAVYRAATMDAVRA